MLCHGVHSDALDDVVGYAEIDKNTDGEMTALPPRKNLYFQTRNMMRIDIFMLFFTTTMMAAMS